MAGAPVVHRGAGVDDERDADVALFLVLLDVVAVGAGEDAPVEPAEVVAGGVLAVLGELDVEAVEGAAVQAADRPLDEPARPQRQVGDLGDGVRIGILRATAASAAPLRTGTSSSSRLTIESLDSPAAWAL